MSLTQKLFECGDDDQDGFNDEEEQNNTTLTRCSAYKLSVRDEYILVLIKLRMRLSTIDLAERFCREGGGDSIVFEYLSETDSSLPV